MITFDDIVRRLNEEGIKVTKRTVRYYKHRGLLPESKRTGVEGGGVYSLFPNNALNRIKKIYALKGKGWTLKDIEKKFWHKFKVIRFDICPNLHNLNDDAKYKCYAEINKTKCIRHGKCVIAELRR